MKKALFAGCSYTAGHGLELEKSSPELWVNLLHQNTWLKQYELNNCAMGGRSNAGIFQDAVSRITQGDVAVALVCWTSVPRFEMELGVETYPTRAVFLPNGPLPDHNLHDIQYSKSYLEGVRDRVISLVHPHYEIVNVIRYVNALLRLAKLTQTKLFFVNAICPWDRNYFTQLHDVLPNAYTKFTQQTLHTQTRDDDEIYKIYNKIHHEYQSNGGIQPSHWLNLYDSFDSQKIDTNQDGVHPGPKSNQFYFEQLSKFVSGEVGHDN